MNTPQLISVLIRTKDRKDLLQDALRSVQAQTWPAIEVIIVNDGGRDFSDTVVPPGTNNIRWLNNTGRHGRSHAANLALENAGGQLCLFLDDDDSIDPDHLDNLATALKANPEHVAAYSAVRVMTDGITEAEPSFRFPFDPVRLMVENTIPIHAVLFRRELVDAGIRFDPAFDRFEDWDFWLQAAEKHSFVFVDRCTATYRVDSASGFGAKENPEAAMDEYRMALYRKWLPRWPDSKILALINRSREYPRITGLAEANADLIRQRDVRTTQVRQMEALLLEHNDQLREQKDDLDRMQQQVQELQQVTSMLYTQRQTIFNSRSWRLTRPLRALTQLRYYWREEGFGSALAKLRAKRKTAVSPAAVPEAKPAALTPLIAQAYTPLAFPECDKPRFSIVIPCYNQHLYTFHCLRSILEHLDALAVEVIVVDDQSTDATASMLAGISGIRVIRNEHNSGFIKTCNTGAAAARGEYLVLLNNDTEVTPGWLQALDKTFTDFPDAGLVGARLLNTDGSLQEAGGIVWQDGSAWNFGRNDDPNKPEYCYCRPVDYCSGACLMLRLEDFRALNGFDERYLPAYYEDTDLAFRIREMGKQVYYQPGATVYHFEGVTSGTDLNTGIKQYQQVNQAKFFKRWQKILATHRANGRLPHLEKDRSINRRILVIDARVLMPDQDSGSLRMFNILRILQKLGYKVTFIPSNLMFVEHYTPRLQALGIECQYTPYASTIKDYLAVWGYQFNAVILSRVEYADRFIDAVLQHCSQAKILFDTVDLHFLREQREAALSADRDDIEAAARRKIQELGVARKADVTLVVSPVELEMFRQEAPDVDVRLLSNIHTTHATAGTFQERRDILFIGSFEHPPNVDAMEYFLDAVFPLVIGKNPDIRLHIVGGHLPRHIAARASDNIIIAGFVADIQPLFDSIRLSIAPLRYGAGVKGKINSSLSYGVPMVVTPIAAEGMNLVHEQDILIADAPEDFAAAILRLYDDETLWEKLSAAGKRNIEENFSFALAESQLRAVLPG